MKQEDKWESLVINRRKPYTYRAFYQNGDYRICLHRFESCDEHEAFYHPHPWPGAFLILSGSYQMKIGYSADRFSKPEPVAEFLMNEGSRYEISNPLSWHTVQPESAVYTIMVNGLPWSPEVAHTEVRTTKGKDLQKMTQEELGDHFDAFKILLQRQKNKTR